MTVLPKGDLRPIIDWNLVEFWNRKKQHDNSDFIKGCARSLYMETQIITGAWTVEKINLYFCCCLVRFNFFQSRKLFFESLGGVLLNWNGDFFTHVFLRLRAARFAYLEFSISLCDIYLYFDWPLGFGMHGPESKPSPEFFSWNRRFCKSDCSLFRHLTMLNVR